MKYTQSWKFRWRWLDRPMEDSDMVTFFKQHPRHEILAQAIQDLFDNKPAVVLCNDGSTDLYLRGLIKDELGEAYFDSRNNVAIRGQGVSPQNWSAYLLTDIFAGGYAHSFQPTRRHIFDRRQNGERVKVMELHDTPNAAKSAAAYWDVAVLEACYDAVPYRQHFHKIDRALRALIDTQQKGCVRGKKQRVMPLISFTEHDNVLVDMSMFNPDKFPSVDPEPAGPVWSALALKNITEYDQKIRQMVMERDRLLPAFEALNARAARFNRSLELMALRVRNSQDSYGGKPYSDEVLAEATGLLEHLEKNGETSMRARRLRLIA